MTAAERARRCGSQVGIGPVENETLLRCEKDGGHTGDHEYRGDDSIYLFTVIWSENTRRKPEDEG